MVVLVEIVAAVALELVMMVILGLEVVVMMDLAGEGREERLSAAAPILVQMTAWIYNVVGSL